MGEKYGVWAVRSAASMFGLAQSWCKDNGKKIEFESMKQAEQYACQLNKNCFTPNVHYFAKKIEYKNCIGGG